MHTHWVFLCAVLWIAPSAGAFAAESEKALADRIFGNADKNDDDTLDDKELLEAKRIFKAAIFEKKKADDLPGGKATFEKIENVATKGKLGDKKESPVTKEQWRGHVSDAFDKKEAILKEAKEKAAQAAAAAKKKQEEQAKIDRLRREKEELEKKLKQKNKNKK